MDALKPEAQGRTKANIAAIRHLYLAVTQKWRSRSSTTEPKGVLDTSPGKLQVVWKVEGERSARRRKPQ
jgi:hypothetical protein